ncbi:MAG: beta-ketoacyl-ACP synthase II, partial [Chloroflexi bacterium]|nr:beta-ketoacyl-ACP synthase II [Chloroflexota bacterium]
REAIADAGLTADGIGDRGAVITGSGIGGIQTNSEQTVELHDRGPSRISPFLIPMILTDMAAGMIAMEVGFKGPNMSVSSACASAANAIGEASEMLRRGAADVAICGGSEAAVVPIAVAGFSAMRAISERNDAPECACRPFDRDRDGFIIGEGSAMLVLETLEHATARGARIHCELAGYGSTDDAFHMTAPDEDGAGAAACMRRALEAAGLSTGDVDYINAHGTSTPLNDATETRAIKALFGEQAYSIPISSTKSTHGHLLGATGALEAVLSVRALEEGVLPPTMNLDNPEDECDLDYIPNQARRAAIRSVLSNSFGFGGHNACLVFTKF